MATMIRHDQANLKNALKWMAGLFEVEFHSCAEIACGGQLPPPTHIVFELKECVNCGKAGRSGCD